MECDQIGEEDEIVGSLGGQPHQSREGPRYGDHAGVGERGTAPAAKQEADGQRLVDHARKRMGRIHRHRRKQEIELPLAVFLDESPGGRIQLVQP